MCNVTLRDEHKSDLTEEYIFQKKNNLVLITKTFVPYASSSILGIVKSGKLKCGTEYKEIKVNIKDLGQYLMMMCGWNWLKIVPNAELWLLAMLYTPFSPLF
jgi:hypothetical protein